nr:MAG TPA: hypothetical protein [Caudoviricetes sp.]
MRGKPGFFPAAAAQMERLDLSAGIRRGVRGNGEGQAACI